MGSLQIPTIDEERSGISEITGRYALSNQSRSDLQLSGGHKIRNFGDVMQSFALDSCTTKHIPSYKMKLTSICIDEESKPKKWQD